MILQFLPPFLRAWRAGGQIPLDARHAKCFITWSKPKKLRDVLSSSSYLHDWLAGKSVPRCVCNQLLEADPTWPTVTIDGQEHVAALACTAPWPEHLQSFAKWPATLSLPPRWHDIAACVRDCFRSFRRRCKLKHGDAATEDMIVACTAELWSLAQSSLRDQDEFPISWEQITAAKLWPRDLFVSVFDHNLSCLGLLCPKLAKSPIQGRAWQARRPWMEVLFL